MKAKRIFDVTDDSYSAEEAKAERAIKLRTVQGERYAKAQEQLARWRTRLKRAQRQVRKLDQRCKYYRKVLA
jgi:molecular chaperone GrpE (heat shock protein)